MEDYIPPPLRTLYPRRRGQDADCVVQCVGRICRPCAFMVSRSFLHLKRWQRPALDYGRHIPGTGLLMSVWVSVCSTACRGYMVICKPCPFGCIWRGRWAGLMTVVGTVSGVRGVVFVGCLLAPCCVWGFGHYGDGCYQWHAPCAHSRRREGLTFCDLAGMSLPAGSVPMKLHSLHWV